MCKQDLQRVIIKKLIFLEEETTLDFIRGSIFKQVMTTVAGGFKPY